MAKDMDVENGQPTETTSESEPREHGRRRPRFDQENSGDDRRGGRRFGGPRRRVCAFCVDKVKVIDHKAIDVLSRYVTERGRIRPRRKTSTCAAHQRELTVAIKRARHLALLPYVTETSN